MKKAAGLIYGPDSHHLDHLAVICKLMQIPLFVTEEEIAALGKKYYPHLEVISLDYLHAASHLVQNFDVLFCSLPRDLFDEVFFFAEHLFHKRIPTIWCPHGNSDKGNASYFMEALYKEEAALVYGKKMIDFLIQKDVFKQLKSYVIIGNVRYQFYLKNIDFYKKIIQAEIEKKFARSQPTILYAPTWQDAESSSSFFQAAPLLLKSLPEHYNLIVKIHPNLRLQAEQQVQKILEPYEGNPNVLFLNAFPPIYPLLDFVDLYIGDMSSIGYDFLIFDKPMFFLNQNRRDPQKDPGLFLFRCGIEILPEQYDDVYSIMEYHLATYQKVFSSIRKEVYDYTFGREKNWDKLREEITHAIEVISVNHLNLEGE